jgi:hypothetical protein
MAIDKEGGRMDGDHVKDEEDGEQEHGRKKIKGDTQQSL